MKSTSPSNRVPGKIAIGDNAMVKLTAEQCELLKSCASEPVRLLDPGTNQEYVLVPAETYGRIQAILSDLDPREFYPALHRAMDQEGWNDPHMDEYNRYG